MKKAKKTKVPQHRTELDRIVTQLRAILRRETSDVVQAGNLLIKARELFANEHGKWLPWLAENFDLSPRTAQRYIAAAEYVQKRQVSLFGNLSATVLYGLAAGRYSEQEEAEILAQAKAGKRIGEDRAWAICEKLALPDDDDADDADDQDDSDDDGGDDAEPAAAEDPEIVAIFDNPPAVAPTAPNLVPTDYALRNFDRAIGVLKRLMTKQSTQFARTIHSANDLEAVESFLHAVTKTKTKDRRQRCKPNSERAAR